MHVSATARLRGVGNPFTYANVTMYCGLSIDNTGRMMDHSKSAHHHETLTASLCAPKSRRFCTPTSGSTTRHFRSITSENPNLGIASTRTAPHARRLTIARLLEIVNQVSTRRSLDHSDARAAVVFIDMSGFTALTEIHGDHIAAQLAEDFAAITATALGPGDDLVKTLGDAVMVSCSDANAALSFLSRLGVAVEGVEGIPMLRAGVSPGPVIKRNGDVYGNTVNTAARLVALAAPGQIIVSRDVAAAACDAELSVTPLGPINIRNLSEPADLFAIDAAGGHTEHVDPVCRMHVSAATTAAVLVHDGRSYRFCSAACAERFDPSAARSQAT